MAADGPRRIASIANLVLPHADLPEKNLLSLSALAAEMEPVSPPGAMLPAPRARSAAALKRASSQQPAQQQQQHHHHQQAGAGPPLRVAARERARISRARSTNSVGSSRGQSPSLRHAVRLAAGDVSLAAVASAAAAADASDARRAQDQNREADNTPPVTPTTHGQACEPAQQATQTYHQREERLEQRPHNSKEQQQPAHQPPPRNSESSRETTTGEHGSVHSMPFAPSQPSNQQYLSQKQPQPQIQLLPHPQEQRADNYYITRNQPMSSDPMVFKRGAAYASAAASVRRGVTGSSSASTPQNMPGRNAPVTPSQRPRTPPMHQSMRSLYLEQTKQQRDGQEHGESFRLIEQHSHHRPRAAPAPSVAPTEGLSQSPNDDYRRVCNGSSPANSDVRARLQPPKSSNITTFHRQHHSLIHFNRQAPVSPAEDAHMMDDEPCSDSNDANKPFLDDDGQLPQHLVLGGKPRTTPDAKRAQNRESAKRFRVAQKKRWAELQTTVAGKDAEIEKLKAMLQEVTESRLPTQRLSATGEATAAAECASPPDALVLGELDLLIKLMSAPLSDQTQRSPASNLGHLHRIVVATTDGTVTGVRHQQGYKGTVVAGGRAGQLLWEDVLESDQLQLRFTVLHAARMASEMAAEPVVFAYRRRAGDAQAQGADFIRMKGCVHPLIDDHGRVVTLLLAEFIEI